MTNTPRGLGRGLGELFQRTEAVAPRTQVPRAASEGSSAPPAESAASPDPQSGAVPQTSSHPVPAGSFFAEIPIDQIQPNPKQPRMVFDEDALAELVQSITEVGLLQPVVVRPLHPSDRTADSRAPQNDADRNGGFPDSARFELVMGERRWRASQQAGSSVIPAIVRETEDHDLLRDALLENLHRTQLNPLEEAAAYQQMLEDFGCTQDELSQRIKRSRPQISNTIRLLKLPPTVQRRVAAGVLSAGHARAVLALDDQLAQEQLAQRVVAEGLSVRATEELVALGDTGAVRGRRARSVQEPSDQARDLAEHLSGELDTRVRVDSGRSKGRIVIEFASEEDLGRISGLLRSARRPID